MPEDPDTADPRKRQEEDPSPRTRENTPPAIPDHELLKCIGRGSYGEVWLAKNVVGTLRAVKIVYRKSFDNNRPFERELMGIRKFEPVSRSHEGFIDVLQVGIDPAGSYFYYVMELGDDQVSGQQIDPARYSPKTLAKEVSPRHRLPFQECIRLGIALTEALSELHKRGLVHRDVKPSNIIFVHGIPKLADIGLVAETNEARSYVGTEGFIPPEGPGTSQADVYSLGKTLYELATGRDRHDFPELPTQFDLLSDREGLIELNEIILNACRSEIGKRYQSAWEMHTDLLVIANGKSVKRLKLLERRLTRLKHITAVFAIGAVLLSVILYPFYLRWKESAEARQRQVGANLAYGNRAMDSGDLLGALPYFADAMQLDKDHPDQERSHRLRLGAILAQCPKMTRVWSLGRRLEWGEFSPDGRQILLAEYYGKSRIYDLRNGEMYLHPFGQTNWLVSASYSPNGRFIVTASEDHSVCIWIAATLENAFCLPHPDVVVSARFSPDSTRVVTSCIDGVARVWNLDKAKVELELKHTKKVRFADFSPDGRLIVTASEDNSARIWDAKNGRLIKVLEHNSWVISATFSPDNKMVITACADHKARVWSVVADDGPHGGVSLNHDDGVTSAEFSPDGRVILTASWDGVVRLWRADQLRPLEVNPILKLGERLTHACFSHDGRCVLVTGYDGSVLVWDFAGSSPEPLACPCHFSQDGSRFLILTNGSLEIRDAISATRIGPSINSTGLVEKAELNRNGSFVISMARPSQSRSSLLQVLDSVTAEPIGPGISFSNDLFRIALGDDGSHLVVFAGPMAQIWNVLDGTPLAPPLLHQHDVDSAFFNREGDRVATCSGKKICVWETSSGRPCYPPLEFFRPVHQAEFSPDGTKLVGCCWDPEFTKCYAQVWDAATGKPIGPRLNHGDGVLSSCFSPDGNRVVTASEDFTAVVWQVPTGWQQIAPVRHQEKVQTASFNLDGRWFVTASIDKTSRIWNAQDGYPLTPPLQHLTKLKNSFFAAHGSEIVTIDLSNETRIWKLAVDERPIADLVGLAHLLAGSTMTRFGGGESPQSGSLETQWQRLRVKYPETFETTEMEIADWHEFQARECETNGQWFAAVFHLQILAAVQPQDKTLARRLAAAEQALTSNH